MSGVFCFWCWNPFSSLKFGLWQKWGIDWPWAFWACCRDSSSGDPDLQIVSLGEDQDLVVSSSLSQGWHWSCAPSICGAQHHFAAWWPPFFGAAPTLLVPEPVFQFWFVWTHSFGATPNLTQKTTSQLVTSSWLLYRWELAQDLFGLQHWLAGHLERHAQLLLLCRIHHCSRLATESVHMVTVWCFKSQKRQNQ